MVSIFHKFKLLMWKHKTLTLRNYWILLGELSAPLLIIWFYITILRSFSHIEELKEELYPPFNASQNVNICNSSKPTIALSPGSPLLRKILSKICSSAEIVEFDDAAQLDNKIYYNNDFSESLLFAVKFNDKLKGVETNKNLPKNIDITLRLPSVDSNGEKQSWFTTETFFRSRNSKQTNTTMYGKEPFYQKRGFLHLQQLITLGLIDNKNITNNFTIEMNRYPDAPESEDNLYSRKPRRRSLIFVTSNLLVINFCINIYFMGKERKQQLKESLKVLGLPEWLNFFSWFSRHLVTLTIAILFTSLLTKFYEFEGHILFPKSNTIIIYIFVTLSGGSLIAASFVFATITTNTILAVILGLFVYSIAILIVIIIKLNTFVVPKGVSIVASFLSPCAAYFGAEVIMEYEWLGEGIQWDTIWKETLTMKSGSLGQFMMMLLLDTVLYTLVALYVDALYPGVFGVPKPWHFVCTELCCPIKTVKIAVYHQEANDRSDFFENAPKDKAVGILLKKISKNLNPKTRDVKELDLELYSGQICVLLGENGAGKSTIVSIITGAHRPSNGNVYIKGHDIIKNSGKVKSILGICFQHNVIFDFLTVSDNFYFFGKLKGMNNTEIKIETEYYLQALNLSNKTNIKLEKLSPSLKRQLCTAIALCGNSEVVILDEPTAGLDPAAMRKIWDLIQDEKKDRTILLTTSFLNEADLLGDKIAVMAAGEIRCYGSKMYLKSKFETGYYLILDITPECNINNISGIIRKHIGKEIWYIQHESNEDSLLKYRLAEDEKEKFQDILHELETNMSDLGIRSFEMSLAGLDEIYKKATSGPEIRGDILKSSLNIKPVTMHLGSFSIRNQIYAMCLKNLLRTFRIWYIILFQVLIPLFFLALLVPMGFSRFSYKDETRALKISLDGFQKTIILLAGEKNNYYKIYHKIGRGHEINEVTDIVNTVLHLSSKYPLSTIQAKYIVAASFQNKTITAWFNSGVYHAVPLSLSLVLESIYKDYFGVDHTIEFYNDPLPLPLKLQFEKSNNQLDRTVIALLLGTGLPISFSLFIIYYIQERRYGVKLLQFTSGANVVIFWCCAFVLDMVKSFLICVAIIITLAALRISYYDSSEILGFIVLLLMSSTFFILPFVYLSSLFYRSNLNGFSFMIIMLYFADFVALIVEQETEEIYYTSLLLPFAAYVLGICELETFVVLKKLCGKFNSLEEACKEYSKCCATDDYYLMERPGLGLHLLLPIILGTILFLVLIGIDCGYFRCFKKLYASYKGKKKKLQKITFEEGVTEETMMIKNTTKHFLDINYALVMRDVTKNYYKNRAVKGICLAVRHNECLGLLGLSDSGKSTVLKMIIGDEEVSNGEIRVKGFDTKYHSSKIRKLIGYCPQVEALFPNLTPREILKMFALIRGVEIDKCGNLCEELAQELDFVQNLNEKVKHLSLGTKRKLNIAISLIGDPPIICLDEPTKGMDPGVKRHIWNKLCQLRRSGKCIILASQNIEECITVCDRIVIMEHGKFEFFGTTEKLKHKFADNYLLTIRINKSEDLDIKMDKVKKFISLYFREAKVKELFQEVIIFILPKKKMLLSEIYGLIEKYKTVLEIDDYALGQCNLKQAFLEFAENY